MRYRTCDVDVAGGHAVFSATAEPGELIAFFKNKSDCFFL